MTHLRLLAGLCLCVAAAHLSAQPAPTPVAPPPQPTVPMQPVPMQPVPMQPVPMQPVPMQPMQPAVDPNAVAATVNGAPIHELAVQRALEGTLPAQRAEKRPEVLGYLIDNALIDQYLVQAKMEATPQEVDTRLNEMKAELAKRKLDLSEMLKNFKLTEGELRQHIASDVRWERFLAVQSTDMALKQLFDGNKDMFDGSTVQARHILLTPPSGDARANEAAVAALRSYRQQVEAMGQEALKKVPATADALAREKARATAVEEAFIALAKDKSACPSKARGGDLGSFERVGFMVEPFARAAFAMKPFEISDVVKSPYGYHLILVLDRKPGKEVQFEQVKERVRDVFAERLRDNMATQLRARAQIVIHPVK